MAAAAKTLVAWSSGKDAAWAPPLCPGETREIKGVMFADFTLP